MAQMIPASIPSGASEGEKTLFAILRDRLPNDFIVWYEPQVKGRYPDFIILGREFGLLVIEVKGWSASQVENICDDFFYIKHRSRELTERELSPLSQARKYSLAMLDKIKDESILIHHQGRYQGKPIFPINFGVVLSNMTTTQAQNHQCEIYTHLEPHNKVAYRDEFLEWKNFSTEKLIERLKSMFPEHLQFPIQKMTDDQISTIKGLIRPGTAIKRIPATKKSVPAGVELQPDSSIIVTLDVEQERLAQSLGDGHRLISGVAGSGKTLILLTRAKMIADRSPSQHVLILCFNITLASHLRSLLHTDDQNPQYREQIEVMHFNAWAKSIIGGLPNPEDFNSGEEYDRYLGERVLATLQKLPIERKWDSVLMDEAHIFDSSWFPCCVEALKDPQNGDLLIVSDRNQSVYKRRRFTWNSVGIKAQGRSRKLNQNYRNTQEILTAAWNVVKPASVELAVGNDITFPIIEPSAALRRGAKPVFHLARLKEGAVDDLIHQIKNLIEAGYAPEEIAILYRNYTHKNSDLFTEMLTRINGLGLRVCWITRNRNTRLNYNINISGIRVITALSSLGLEFKVVLLLWVEQFADCCNSDLEESSLARRQLYVAMTRAQDELHLFGSGNTRILQELQQSQSFEVLQESAVPVNS